MAVCRNWTGTLGSCRFGERCRFDHPDPNRSGNNNPFAPLQNNYQNPRNGNGYQAPPATAAPSLPFQLDKAQIITDLTTERPQWILSAYGPGRHAPEQLFGGPAREISFEELHLLHRAAERAGNIQQAVQEAQTLHQQSEQQIQTILNNVDGAIEYIINAEKTHPNRLDAVQSSAKGASSTNAFAHGNAPNTFQATPPTNSAFGASSQAVAPSAFGAPSLNSTGGAFGQPSALGARPGAFGAPSQLGAGSGAFGQPSALGQKPNPFGAPSGGAAPGFAQAGNTFGQPSQRNESNPFGATQPASTPFGAPSQSAPSNVFGAPSQPASANALGGAFSTPFGAPSPAPKNPFGAPSQPAAPNQFGAPSNQNSSSNPFGAPSTATSNPFGASSQASASNVFERPSAPAPNVATVAPPGAGPFSKPQFGAQAPSNPFSGFSNSHSSNANQFGKSPSPVAGTGYKPVQSSDNEHPPLSSYATHANGRLTRWKGQQVVYRDELPGYLGPDRLWVRIWYPNGPPPPNPDTELPEEMYDEGTKQAYLHLRQTGKFPEGKIPFLPPRQEWIQWDF